MGKKSKKRTSLNTMVAATPNRAETKKSDQEKALFRVSASDVFMNEAFVKPLVSRL